MKRKRKTFNLIKSPFNRICIYRLIEMADALREILKKKIEKERLVISLSLSLSLPQILSIVFDSDQRV